MNVIITGGSGFVGQHLQKQLKTQWPDVQIVSWDLPTVDITNPATYTQQLQDLTPQWIVHLAAVASVSASLKQPDITYQVNVEGTERLLRTAQEVSPETSFLIASSSDIYGDTELAQAGKPIPELPLREARPHNPYAESKIAMEKMIEEKYKESCIIVRPFAHIGPGQKIGFVTADFASQIAAIEKGKKEPVIRVGNLEASRDFTDVRDVVRAYAALMQHAPLGEVFNIASGKAVQIKDVLSQLLKLSEVAIQVENDPERMRPSDIHVLIGDATKLQRLTGWEPQIPIEETLKEILQYWRSQT